MDSVTEATTHPAVFLDRDGVIIENRHDYVKSWDEVQFLPGALEALRQLSETSYRIVMVTNQSAVGRGIITHSEAVSINERILAVIESHGARIDAVYMCPHHPDDGCACRKPRPGMLFEAQERHALDLERSFLVGDAASDIAAANAVGVKGILVLTGRGLEYSGRADLDPYAVAENLEASLAILAPSKQYTVR